MINQIFLCKYLPYLDRWEQSVAIKKTKQAIFRRDYKKDQTGFYFLKSTYKRDGFIELLIRAICSRVVSWSYRSTLHTSGFRSVNNVIVKTATNKYTSHDGTQSSKYFINFKTIARCFHHKAYLYVCVSVVNACSKARISY